MSKKLSATKKSSKSQSFPIVAIGASAGGVEAVTELFRKIPASTDMAFVYIQHLDPAFDSKLDVILAKITKMKVQKGKDKLVVKPNNVYVIPPNTDMSITNGALSLAGRDPKPAIHLPIDKFFISLAENQKENAIGVLLSGNAHDGTLGLKAIKTAGGLTFAQDETAKFQSMPKSAISEGVVDMILSPAEIAVELVSLGKQAEVIKKVLGDLGDREIDNNDESLLGIIQLLKKNVGVDFSHYKMNTIKRRILRRMLLYKFKSLTEYHQYLRQHTAEVNTLYQDLLINVTSFFRDPETTEYLRKTLLPRILKAKEPNEPLRVWVAGCSTGEEAYSMAMVIMEVLGDKAGSRPVQIFATDLSDLAIAKARLGIYTKSDVVDVSPKRLLRFFTKIDGSYRILKSLRDLCVFASHNILKDPPFSRMDVISCCNMMIYLDSVLQKKILSTFHYALQNTGYLILGKSESVTASSNLFIQREKKYKIYSRKKDVASRALLDMTFKMPGTKLPEVSSSKRLIHKEAIAVDGDLEKVVDSILLNQYVPASVVVTRELDIQQFRGSTGLFLEPLPGKASLNLLKMARPSLAFEIRNAVHKAGKLGTTIRKAGLEIKNKSGIHPVSIEVTPLQLGVEEKLFLIVFEEAEKDTISDSRIKLTRDKLVTQLQNELRAAKDDMSSIIEEQEASNEELQSANEEIVSSNEELQSINEELETSKEEVESTNEELITINTELQTSNEQLAEAYEYSEAMFGTIREAVLVLDINLKVKSANQSFYNIFGLREEKTIDNLIFDLDNQAWDIPALRDFLQEVTKQNMQHHGYEITYKFSKLGEKTLLLNARKIVQKVHNQQLVLLAIEDITEHRQAQKIISERESWLRQMADNAPVMIWVANTTKIYTFINKTWLEYTGRSLQNTHVNDWTDAIHPEDIQTYLKVFHSSFADREPFNVEYRLKRKDGVYRWIMDIGKPTFLESGEFTGYIGSCTEIHDKRVVHEDLERTVNQRTKDLLEANKNLRNSNSELEQFAYVASHDLQEPLRKIITFADRLESFKEELPEKGKVIINKITESSQRMTRLIDDVLNFSRVSFTGKKISRTDLNAVLNDVLMDFDITISQKEAKIISDQLPVIPAISIQMEQLFHNMISNALKFSKEGVPPEINIQCKLLKSEELQGHSLVDVNKPYYELMFSDNGIGFEPEYADQIFTIFQRIADKQKFPGTGIGLALVRKIVNNHGGIIYAESEIDKGATFHVILPAE